MTAPADSELLAWDESSGRGTLTVRGDWTLDNYVTLGEQIAQLQDAATQNADSIKKLATDMQKTIEVLQVGADQAERRLRR